MISTDRNLFQENSEVRSRIIEYGELVDELHIIVFSNQKSKIKIPNSNIFLYPTNSWNRWLYVKDAIKIGKKILMANGKWLITCQDPFETGIIGYRIANKYKIPLQLQVHTDFLSPYFWRESLLNKIRVVIANFLIPRADCIRVVSERIKKSINTKYSGIDAKIDILPIFVDVKSIKNSPVTIDLRKKYSQFDFIILIASRLTQEKNIELAINAMSGVIKKHPKTGLVIVGDGPECDKLELRIKNYELGNNVKIENWTDDLSSYYKTSDLFLLTSNYEGYGRTIIEAMSAGCPVITTDVGLAGDILRDGDNGIVIPIGDREKLTEAILDMIENKQKRESLIQNADKTIDEFYDKEEYFKRYKSLWQNCF